MMSPRLPLHLLTHARRARRFRLQAATVLATCAACVAIATAASPATAADAGAASSDERAASRAWNPFFDQQRPVVSVDARRVVVRFSDPSLGEWIAAGDEALSPVEQRRWMAKARLLQQKRLDALAEAGVQFRIEQRYLRVLNGVSIVVLGDGAQLLRGVAGVETVTSVRTVWPAALDATGAEGAAAAVGSASAPGDATGAVRVAVLDTALDASHAAVAGHVGAAFDATATLATDPAPAAQTKAAATPAAPIAPDAHGTAVAGAVLRGAGDAADAVQLLPIRVLAARPDRSGVESVTGDSDDVLAGLEHAVDPDGNGDVSDAADVAVIASTTPFSGFAGSPEDVASSSAAALGTLLVAAAGNDGASGDDVGTVGAFAAGTGSLAVGAADLRGRTPAVDVRVLGSGIDQTFDGAPLLTSPTNAALPTGKLSVQVVDGPGSEVVDYLDAELRSRVGGAVALVAARDGVTIAEQARAAADAGAIALVVGTNDADAAAGTIDVPGVDIPVVALELSDARALRAALLDGTRLTLDFDGTLEDNPAFGTVAGFSSSGPRLDGIGRPDALAPGVGMVVAADHGGWRIASGTSIAAGWAAGQAAAVRSEQPEWSAATTRAALLGSATALGSDRKRPSVALQGAGVLDAAKAAALGWVTHGGRLDLGTIAPGKTARVPLDLEAVAGAASASGAKLTVLLDDGGRSLGVTPSLVAGEELQLAVSGDARPGHVGGWLVLPEHGIRIPWTATIGDASAADVPVRSQLSSRVFATPENAGAFGATLTLAIGGSGDGAGSLGLAAVQRLEVRLVDASGRDHGVIGGLDQALPGVYTFGLSGIDPKGKPLGAGAWQLEVRYVPAADPRGDWRDGPVSTIVVPRAKPAAPDA